MIPPANLIGFSGQELARKLPHVFGVLMEITFVFLVVHLLLHFGKLVGRKLTCNHIYIGLDLLSKSFFSWFY